MNCLPKSAAVLPEKLREAMESERIFAATDRDQPIVKIDVKAIRDAILLSRKVDIVYRDGKDAATEREKSGPSRSLSSMTSGSWWRGARRVMIFAISARTGSRAQRLQPSAIPGTAAHF